MLREEGSQMVINIKPVQQQSNGVDCGLFAIAFVTSLLNGEDPAKVTYDTDDLRPHLMRCFASGNICPFKQVVPAGERRCAERALVTNLFCTCRMPWTPQDNRKRQRRWPNVTTVVNSFVPVKTFPIMCFSSKTSGSAPNALLPFK